MAVSNSSIFIMNQLKTDSTQLTQLDVVNQSIKPPAENMKRLVPWEATRCSWGSQPHPTKSCHPWPMVQKCIRNIQVPLEKWDNLKVYIMFSRPVFLEHVQKDRTCFCSDKSWDSTHPRAPAGPQPCWEHWELGSQVTLRHSSLTSPSAGPGIALGGSKVCWENPAGFPMRFFRCFLEGPKKIWSPCSPCSGMKKMGKALHFVDPSRNVGHLGTMDSWWVS